MATSDTSFVEFLRRKKQQNNTLPDFYCHWPLELTQRQHKQERLAQEVNMLRKKRK